MKKLMRRFWSFLKKIKNLLEDEAINKNELIDIIDAGLGEIRVGIIPAKVDRVIIGDLKRSRLANIKALFIIGLRDRKSVV